MLNSPGNNAQQLSLFFFKDAESEPVINAGEVFLGLQLLPLLFLSSKITGSRIVTIG